MRIVVRPFGVRRTRAAGHLEALTVAATLPDPLSRPVRPDNRRGGQTCESQSMHVAAECALCAEMRQARHAPAIPGEENRTNIVDPGWPIAMNRSASKSNGFPAAKKKVGHMFDDMRRNNIVE